ncbi:hypothetical protein U0035_09430 [Niabella yanshanensis]|uniref:DUF4919 domain-containing protein n=1 Tax=Niabella yanshanensis TaxID=577386 RepID=A0ABZ0WCT6_9BACT|nr:hypothetical protein [Niabella yanshanensis]WQD40365.1 hypothetical protein U0035_09430 [Niabella yanshanensis]
MLKYFFAIAIFVLPVSFIQAQSNFTRTVKEYYRVNPFQGNFSSFVEALTTDPSLLKKEIYRQTDTTGYFVKGEYDVFNPYSINANKVDMLFYENVYKSKNRVLFSFYTYQLTTYFPDTELARRAVAKDYKKLVKKIRKDMYDTQRQSLKGYNNIEDGEITTFNDSGSTLEPVVVSWQTLAKTKQLGLTIILRLEQDNNYAYPINHKNRIAYGRY